MTYEERLKNIETVINWVSPLENFYIWFTFDHRNQISITYLSSEEIEKWDLNLHRHAGPIAQLSFKDEQVYLYYDDDLLIYEYNLTIRRLEFFMSLNKPLDLDQLKIEFADLLNILKK